jgi:anaerobic selenocysteine-containing dehydrogenase
MTIADEARPADEATAATRTAVRTCPLCEAGCGLEITLRPKADGGEEVVRIRGDQDDVFSHGYICPKGSTLKQLHEDPDRVRTPLIKRDGAFVPATWDEAFAEIEARLLPILERDGRDACAAYIGNPSAHNLAGLLYGRAVLRALGTTNVFSASTVDQRPKEISSALMFGGGLNVPVPDVDRTDFLLMLGANPYASNGSLATAPDWPGRIERLIERGGTLVVVDPRRSRTAEEATEWVPIRPGADAYLLAAMVQVITSEGLADLGPLAELVTGLDEVTAACAPFTPEAVAAACGLPADDIRRLARALAGAPTACVYGRIGTTTAEFGTITSWLVDVLNVLTGNLDRPGGAMFTKAAAGAANTRGTPRFGRATRLHRRTSRVRGLPETMGELPVVALAEEIDTPGAGQVRALITMAGNPVLSTPNGGRLDAALAGLECMVSIDIYVNETTRHADVILPAPSALQKGHYDIALLQLALRDVANYSEPILPLGPDELDEWQVMARLALVLQGQGATADPALVDDLVIGAMVQGSVGDETSPVFGADPDAVLAALAPRTGPERILDFLLRTGPYGEGFGRNPDGLSLDVLLANPHGVDLGPLKPRLPDVLRTPDGMIALAPELLLADVARLHEGLDGRRDHPFVLIGRRHLRSNNSWMHNVNVLVKGKPRCTMHLHPDDAAALGLADGDPAVVRSRVGEVRVPVEVTDAIRPGVVSIPHGWGHDLEGTQLSVAQEHAGVNSNLLADETLFDAISGNAVLNGIPVSVAAVPPGERT